MKRLLTFDQLNELSNWNQVGFIIDLLWNEIKKEIGEEDHRTKHYTSYSYLIFNCEKDKIGKIEKIIKKYTKKLLNLNTLISGKVQFDIHDSEARIIIKNLHTKRVKPNKIIYHCSNSKNRNSILEYGLKLTDHSESNYKNKLNLIYPTFYFRDK
jgi:hypothetical protein